MSIDKRHRLEEEPFTYRISKMNLVMINFEGKYIMTLGNKASAKFIQNSRDKNEFEIQLLLAKATGNFKHGNEKSNKNKNRKG